MDVLLGHFRQVEVDDVGQAVDVDAACRDIRCDEDGHLAALEGFQRTFALRLALVAMDGDRVDIRRRETAHDGIGAVFRPGKDEHGLHFRLTDGLHQKGLFLALFDEADALLDLVGRRRRRSHGHLCRVTQELRGKAFDEFRHGGREEQRLAFCRNMFRDGAERVDEAQVQHLVCFVEHEDFNILEADGALLDQVDQAAGRGDQHVHAALKLADLRADLGAAANHRHAQAEAGAVGFERGGDLAGQFAGRRQHENARALVRGRPLVTEQLVEDRGGEGQRLAGAGLGEAHDIPAGHDQRDGAGLDRGRGGVAGSGQRRFNARREAEGLEGCHVFFQNNTLRPARHVALGSEGSNDPREEGRLGLSCCL